MGKKIAIIGYFAKNKLSPDGQSNKTKIIYNNIVKRYGYKNVSKLDTTEWKNKPIVFFIRTLKLYFSNDDIIVMTAHKGVKILIPLFVNLNRFFSKKIHYIVIGGWLYDKSDSRFKKKLKKVNYIYSHNNSNATSFYLYT